MNNLEVFKYANLAYEEPKTLPEKDIMRFEYHENNTDYFMIAEFKDYIIIASRGTDNIKAWVSNIKTKHTIGLEGKGIHTGFWNSWMKLKPELNTIYWSSDMDWAKKIYITGHSRGGVFAQLIARFLYRRNQTFNINCIVFGSPMVGGYEFVEKINNYDFTIYNIINGWDIVPDLPYKKWGYKQAGIVYKLEQPWWHKFFYRYRDHIKENYLKTLGSK